MKMHVKFLLIISFNVPIACAARLIDQMFDRADIVVVGETISVYDGDLAFSWHLGSESSKKFFETKILNIKVLKYLKGNGKEIITIPVPKHLSWDENSGGWKESHKFYVRIGHKSIWFLQTVAKDGTFQMDSVSREKYSRNEE